MARKKSETHKNTGQFPSKRAVLFVLIILGGLAYGRLVWMGGLFGDDPAVLYAYHRIGNIGFDEFYGWARPYSTWVYKLAVQIAREDLHIWQAISLIMRILSAWMLYILLGNISSGRSPAPFFAAVIALIYPGFTQQAHAIHFLLHFTVLALALTSLLLMVSALKMRKIKRKFPLRGR